MSESILIVDDSATNAKLLRVLLEQKGYEVRAAKDAKDALHVLSVFTPNLILMDVQLPDMSGLALARQLRSNAATKDIVILALTASATKADEANAFAAGCDGYLSKPIDVGSLPTVIALHLAARERKA